MRAFRDEPSISPGEIRRAGEPDHPWVAYLASEVYRDLGEYGSVMPQWLVQPGVVAWIDEARIDEQRESSGVGTPGASPLGRGRSPRGIDRRGFAVLGFYVDHNQRSRTVADLLAIGVAPGYQRHGIGTRLLGHVIRVVGAVAPSHGIHELHLTVSHTNVVGQRWYLRSGFRAVPGQHGTYANGQHAIRMARPLP